jgi:hypothetical protein
MNSRCEAVLADGRLCSARAKTERWDGNRPRDLCRSHAALWDEYRHEAGIEAARARIDVGLAYRHQHEGATT